MDTPMATIREDLKPSMDASDIFAAPPVLYHGHSSSIPHAPNRPAIKVSMTKRSSSVQPRLSSIHEKKNHVPKGFESPDRTRPVFGIESSSRQIYSCDARLRYEMPSPVLLERYRSRLVSPRHGRLISDRATSLPAHESRFLSPLRSPDRRHYYKKILSQGPFSPKFPKGSQSCSRIPTRGDRFVPYRSSGSYNERFLIASPRHSNTFGKPVMEEMSGVKKNPTNTPSPSQLLAEQQAKQMYTQVLQSELLGTSEVPLPEVRHPTLHGEYLDENTNPFSSPTAMASMNATLLVQSSVPGTNPANPSPQNNTSNSTNRFHHPSCPCYDIRRQFSQQSNQDDDKSDDTPAAQLTQQQARHKHLELRCCCDQITANVNFNFLTSPSRTLTFQQPLPSPKRDLDGDFSMTPIKKTSQAAFCTKKKTIRRIPKSPFKVLDAPRLTDDFYLNLVDWSSQNVLAVGLGESIYLWSACTSKVTKLADLTGHSNNSGNSPQRRNDEDLVCSVSWNRKGSSIGVGCGSGHSLIFDVSTCQVVSKLSRHQHRVGVLAWKNNHIVASGSRDRHVWLHDIRVSARNGRDVIADLQFHKQEVCGMEFSYDDKYLASGGNDNKLLIWDIRRGRIPCGFGRHRAAVKAIAWSPHEYGVIATGGGTADRSIRFWNVQDLSNTNMSAMDGPTQMTPLHTVDTGSQVCNLLWSKNVNEIVSTHGYSLNQIVVWKYPTMDKMVTLTGHTYRVLYLAGSPDGQTVVTGAGDETLRFWNIFPASATLDSSSRFDSFRSIFDENDFVIR